MLQKASPADKAASLIARALQRLDKMDDSKLSVVDFCSGGGGAYFPASLLQAI